MSIRNLLLNLIIAIQVATLIAFALILNSLFLGVLVIFAAIIWAIYIVLVVRDHQYDIRYPIVRYRPPKTETNRTPKRPQTIPYNQEEVTNDSLG